MKSQVGRRIAAGISLWAAPEACSGAWPLAHLSLLPSEVSRSRNAVFKSKKAIQYVSSVVAASIVNLLNPVYAAGDSGMRNVSSVHIESNNFATVVSSQPFANPDNCGSSSYAMIQAGDPSYKVQLGVVLTAYAMGRQVNFWLTGCQTTPWGFTVPVAFSVTSN